MGLCFFRHFVRYTLEARTFLTTFSGSNLVGIKAEQFYPETDLYMQIYKLFIYWRESAFIFWTEKCREALKITAVNLRYQNVTINSDNEMHITKHVFKHKTILYKYCLNKKTMRTPRFLMHLWKDGLTYMYIMNQFAIIA